MPPFDPFRGREIFAQQLLTPRRSSPRNPFPIDRLVNPLVGGLIQGSIRRERDKKREGEESSLQEIIRTLAGNASSGILNATDPAADPGGFGAPASRGQRLAAASRIPGAAPGVQNSLLQATFSELLAKTPETPEEQARAAGLVAEAVEPFKTKTAVAREEARAKARGKTTTKVRTEKIQELVGRGLSLSDAQDFADGRVVLRLDPNTGDLLKTNKVTNEVTLLRRGGTGVSLKERAESREKRTSIDRVLVRMPSVLEAVKKGVGMVATAKEFGGKVLGNLPTGEVDVPLVGSIGTGDKAVDTEVVKARTTLRTFREELIAAMKKSGRVPLQEQERILETADKLNFVDSVADAEAAFQQLEQELRTIRQLYEIGPAEAPSRPAGEPSDAELKRRLGIE